MASYFKPHSEAEALRQLGNGLLVAAIWNIAAAT